MVAQKKNPADRNLTAREERFAILLSSGRDGAAAWREAYNKPGVTYANRNAYILMKRPHVARRVAELRKPDEKRLFLTRARKRELLMTWAESEKIPLIDRQRALDIDNRMEGSYKQVVRIEGEITLSAVMKALDQAPALPDASEILELEIVSSKSTHKPKLDELGAPADVAKTDTEASEGPAGKGRAKARTYTE